MSDVEPGEEVEFVVLRDGERETVTLETTRGEDDPTTEADESDRAVVGILVEQAATFEFPSTWRSTRATSAGPPPASRSPST